MVWVLAFDLLCGDVCFGTGLVVYGLSVLVGLWFDALQLFLVV